MVRLERDLPPALAGRAELSAAETGRARVERAQDARDGATRVLVPPAPPDADVGEEAFLQLVLDLARALGWLAYHTRDSRRSVAGFPDLVLARPGGPLRLWELKTARGRLSPQQVAWADVLCLVPGIDYRLVRPADWPWIVRTLSAA